MTRYIRIFDHVEQSIGGLHQVKIVGNHPSRFTASIGYIESFGTPVENVPNREAGRTGIFDWYQNPVPEKPIETSETLETLERETPVVEEVIVEKPDSITLETLETPEEEKAAPVAQKTTAGISENDNSSSSKIYIPIVIASLFLLLSIRLVRRNKFKQEGDQ